MKNVIRQVRKVTYATAQINHVTSRLKSIANDHPSSAWAIERTSEMKAISKQRHVLDAKWKKLESALLASRRKTRARVEALLARTLDQVVMNGVPGLTQTIRDFKAKLATVK